MNLVIIIIIFISVTTKNFEKAKLACERSSEYIGLSVLAGRDMLTSVQRNNQITKK